MLVPYVARTATNNLDKTRGTNTVPLEKSLDKFPWMKAISTNTLSERFEYYLEQRLEDISIIKLHPLNTMTRLLTVDSQEQLDDRMADIAQGLVKKSLEHSIRESVKDIPVIYSVISQQTLVAKLFRNSVGNTEEEDFQANTTSYTTNELSSWKTISGNDAGNTNAVSSWKRVKRNVRPRYGLRLSYAYAAFTIGRNSGRPLVFADIRYHYGRAKLGNITTTDVESLISFPLSDKTLLSIGSIQKIDPPDWNRRFSFKVSQKLDGSRLFVGMTIRETPQKDSARWILGFERVW